MDMFGYVVMGLTTTVSTTMQRNVFIMTTTRENCTRFCSRIGGDTFIKPLLICGQQLQTAFEHLVDQSSLHGSHYIQTLLTHFIQQMALSSPLKSIFVGVRDGSYHIRALAWLRKAEASYCLNTHCKICLHNSDSGAVKVK